MKNPRWTAMPLFFAAMSFSSEGRATDCGAWVDPGPGRFVHRQKNWLPQNAKGALFILRTHLSLKPQDFFVGSNAEGIPVATVENVTLPKDHVLSAYLPEDYRLWRVGVKGGFQAGAHYFIDYVPKGSNPHVPSHHVQFNVGSAAFDSAMLSPAVSVGRSLQRVPVSQLLYATDESPLTQTFKIADRSRQASTGGGLTVLAEKKFAGLPAEKMGSNPECGWQPIGLTLEHSPTREVTWRGGCPVPKGLQVRVWLGMLEVDERFVAAAPVNVAWTDLPFGTCSVFGKILNKLGR